jgi:enoyl-CoA hydratase/carnithine racemase
VVPAQALDDTVNEFAQAICAKSPAVIGLGKRAFYKQIESRLSEAYDIAGEVMTCNMLDPDASEGIDAFLEKRAPTWK